LVNVDVLSWGLPAQVALLAVLVLLSAFFSGSETALISLSATRRRHLAGRGVEQADRVDRLMVRPERIIITILIGNMIVNTAAAAIAASVALRALGDAGLGIATGVMTFVLLTFGEILPKTLAAGKTEAFAMFASRPMALLARVLTPIVWLYTTFTHGMYRLLGVPRERRVLQDEEEFKTIVNIGVEEGVIEQEERAIIHRVIDFSGTTAREAMVPRTDMSCVPVTATVRDTVRALIDSGYSRLPVFEGSRDHVVGILYAKDILAAVTKDADLEPVSAFTKEPYYVPESTRLGDLFRQMRDRRVHMAILLDEFGGTSGLITMEDILEEIVGEIFDEYDTEPAPIVWNEERTEAVIDARTTIDALNRQIGLGLPMGEGYDTIGGFIFHELGRPGVVGDTVVHGAAEFTVERASRRRIFFVRYRRVPPPEAAIENE